ncbi:MULTISPECIES: hypothetical protein [unclassified Curtobacterium]|uniref:hypothetical protein n=1 Tax=unclassified Curtobacterium TaxID=257496 RepID=UPI0008DDFC41|nr:MULTISPECIES: hypothetical protein [unclassified Curtobacterium]OIH95727.1 hypothetical protein BIU92_04295 [Curtobacterium sp. MCBA15_003]OII31296.1 hypothetical protein BIU94_04850 [Curtobacterium sp. MMLR14_006]
MRTQTDPLEQHVAVFGASGSGKTVLLSSFFGGAQEPAFRRTKGYGVRAEDKAQGRKLHRDYLGMRDGATPPTANRFASTEYAFVLEPTAEVPAGSRKTRKATTKPLKTLRVVWHDYPGEWFEQDPDSAQEAERRVETFRSLLSADVAILLVDGQRLAEHPGEEERYLKALLTDFRTGLSELRDDVLDRGRRLARFPRIWALGLSKADLLPELDVERFRDLVLGAAGGELAELHAVLRSYVEDPDALDVGEDFLLLSAARFEPGAIDVSVRTGVDLLMPITAMLPFERFARWATNKQRASAVAENLLRFVGPVVGLVSSKRLKLPTPVGALVGFVVGELGTRGVKFLNKFVADKRKESAAEADFLGRLLEHFAEDLDHGVEQGVLRRGEA